MKKFTGYLRNFRGTSKMSVFRCTQRQPSSLLRQTDLRFFFILLYTYLYIYILIYTYIHTYIYILIYIRSASPRDFCAKQICVFVSSFFCVFQKVFQACMVVSKHSHSHIHTHHETQRGEVREDSDKRKASICHRPSIGREHILQ